MAVDNKYGKVTFEHGTIGEDEPVIVFRAQDALLLAVIDEYRELCEQHGSPDHHLDLIDDTYNQIKNWQIDNADRVRLPTSDGYMERTQG